MPSLRARRRQHRRRYYPEPTCLNLGEAFMDWCQDGEEEEVRQVLAAGQADDWGATRALFFACDEPKVLRLLLEHGADPNEAELRWWYKFDCLKILADFGLDVEAKGHISLQNFSSNRVALKWLLDQGADINKSDCRRVGEWGMRIEGAKDDSLHILNMVAANGDIKLLEYLVARGADLTKSLALHAVSSCHEPAKSLPMLSYLLDEQHMGIDTDTDEFRSDNKNKEYDSGTPLCVAIYGRNLPIVLELMARGADIHTSSISGCEPIKKAIRDSRDMENGSLLPIIQPLIAAGVGATYAMSHAIRALRLRPAGVLLRSGADAVAALEEAREQDEKIQHDQGLNWSRAMDYRSRSRNMVSLLSRWVKDNPS
ncbi:unnamed protein product [Zymoseptoria tritici ST99CH_1A5]|uniref:Uncharacterized protein n=1 Tax=Zymoseptoria tritici ST99CH_1A5 TaxID=1276529 RepID=A0A1Y6L379_ZYMTR|nr:unnamed protein product [Zymoseptoria tritici ST99CH_1A5]